MSGVVKSVKKVFKKIVSNPLGQIALGAAAAYFTAGIGTWALGAMGASSGFLSGTLGTVLSYGISGAVTGAATSLIGGGDILTGALYGGLGGAVMGGVQSALGNYAVDPSAAAADDLATPATEAATRNVQGSGLDQITSNPLPTGVGAQTGSVLNTNAAPALQPAAESGGMLSWIERNPEIAGRVFEGVAKGGLDMLAAQNDSTSEAAMLNAQTNARELDFEKQQYADLRNSYNTTGGMLPAQGMPAPPPYSAPPAGNQQVRWQYNPVTRRIEPLTAPYTVAA